MTRKHMLQGLMDLAAREPWLGELNAVLEDHLLPTCDETGLEFSEIISILGEDLFMSTVWACAFEDLLTREFEDGSNIVDEYLKRRGWKETAAFRAYIGALRNSMVSLYEVSDVVPDTSFRARDLVRGGEPVLIAERSATRYLKQWDRISGRVLQVGQQAQISGAVLQFDPETSENLLTSIRGLGKLTQKEKRQLAEEKGKDFDPSAITDLSLTEKLRRLSPVFTACWLLDVLDRTEQRDLPDLLNTDGDDLIACKVNYQLADGVADDDVRAALNSCADLRPETATLWNWVRPEKRKSASTTQAARSKSGKAAPPMDQGELLLGSVHLDGRTWCCRAIP